MNNHYDVIIIGGGLVGLFLAYILGKEDFKVALVERQPLQPVALSDGEFQTRVSAVNPGCKIVFEKLGLWSKIFDTGRVSSYEEMFVWDSLGKGKIHFECTKIAQPCLGYIIENAVIHNALLAVLSSAPNVELITATPNAIFLPNHQSLGVKLSGRAITTKLLVGADGARSWVREQAQIQVISWPYHHEALVTNVRIEKSHLKTAWQCFLPEGPLALLPLADEHLCSIVWSADPQEIKRLQKMTEDQFNFEITNAFEGRLGKIQRVAGQTVLPLVMSHAKQYIKPRIALIGDAAHTIHPLAGQGVNLGFLDAIVLAENIIAGRNTKKDWGSYSELRDYERRRKSENWLMVIGMEVFKRLFESESMFFVGARSTGLKIIDNIDFLKNQFISYAAGLSVARRPVT